MMFVRPYVTYETSVLQPIGGFEPHRDIMKTVDAFTLGPSGFQQGQLSGASSWIARAKMRFANWRARRAGLNGVTPYGPKPWAGGRVVPMAAAREAMLVAMGVKNIPAQFSPVDASIIGRRY